VILLLPSLLLFFFLFVLVYPIFFLSFVCVFVFHGSLFSNPLYIYLLERKTARCPVMYIKDRHIMAGFLLTATADPKGNYLFFTSSSF
jgi:hypothetical protein